MDAVWLVPQLMSRMQLGAKNHNNETDGAVDINTKNTISGHNTPRSNTSASTSWSKVSHLKRQDSDTRSLNYVEEEDDEEAESGKHISIGGVKIEHSAKCLIDKQVKLIVGECVIKFDG